MTKIVDSSRYLIIFMISFKSLFESIFLGISASVPDAATVIPNGIKTLLANG